MDDKQYYSFKRITSLTPEQLQQNLKKKKVADYTYRNNEIHQGKDDAQMLLEKQQDFDNNSETED